MKWFLFVGVGLVFGTLIMWNGKGQALYRWLMFLGLVCIVVAYFMKG